GLWGRRVEDPEELEEAVRAWLATPGPALLDVVTNRHELVLPAKVEPKHVFGTALYSVKGVLAGRGGDVVDLITDPFRT
ncbi:MAG: ubiquinone-dependent pyruvate dehydrogenase, partial [Brevundimonas sp.]